MEPDQWTELFAPKRKLETTPSLTLWTAQDASGHPVLLTASRSSSDLAASRQVMRVLADCPGVPQVVWETQTAFAVQELGVSVREIVEKSARMEGQTLLKLAIGLLRTLETVHHKGYLHLRINANYIRLESDGKDCFLYGLEAAQPLSSVKASVPALALPFASTRLLQGQRPAPMDDLESLFYLILFAANGSLPWSNAASSAEVLASRQALRSDQLLSGLPEEIAYFHSYVMKLGQGDKPNYRSLRHRFMAKTRNVQNSVEIPWVRKRYNRRASEPFADTEGSAMPKLSLNLPPSQETVEVNTLERSDTLKTLKLPTFPQKLRGYRQTL